MASEELRRSARVVELEARMVQEAPVDHRKGSRFLSLILLGQSEAFSSAIQSMNKWLDLDAGFPQDTGYAAPLGFPFPVSASTNLTTSSSSAWKIENGPRERYLSNPPQKNMQVINLGRTAEMKSLDMGIQQTLPVSNGGSSQSYYPWSTHDMMRSSRNRGAQTDIGIHPTSGNDRAQQVYQSGWSDGVGFEQAGQDLNWLRTTTPRPQLFMSHPPRPATHPIEIDFLGPPGMLRQQQSQPSNSGGSVDNESGSCGDAAQRGTERPQGEGNYESRRFPR
ncbi:hypothetical protein CDL15_Pgr016219 [Punica granatum]|uniref:Uncharacterized protein n=1 Tax=Punica granatum TaxID=22663 RepID=A0A218X015_PUNGR|nr:hypothetical protein CDL15_Pgr016219 [Punica granatum]